MGVVLPRLSLLGALVVGYGLTSSTETRRPTARASCRRRGRRPGHRRGQVDRRERAALGRRGFAVSWPRLGGARAPRRLDDRRRRRQVFGAAGRRPAQRRADAHLRDLIRELGFGLFPWSAVAVFALARPLIRLDATDGRRATNAGWRSAQLYLFLFAGLGFALSAYRVLVLGDGALHRAARDRARDRRLPRRGDRGQPLRAGGRPADADGHAGGRARLLPRARGAGVGPPGRQGAVAARSSRSANSSWRRAAGRRWASTPAWRRAGARSASCRRTISAGARALAAAHRPAPHAAAATACRAPSRSRWSSRSS